MLDEDEVDPDDEDSDDDSDEDDEDPEADESDDDDDDSAEDDDEEDEDDEEDLADHDLREDGPFDLDEVDLDADDIERLDFGSVILTPFENMQIQLQVDQSTNQVQSALVMYEQSALEVALFAAPARTSMVKEITEDMTTQTVAAGGEVEISDGPFGPEIRRVIPVQGEDGEQAYHVSRTWFAQGPRWLLRGVLMGEAALTEGFEDAGELLFEFFCNVVVRRGSDPMVPGDLIPMTLPDGIAPQAEPATE
ncbi:DUF3710 domain-containing protein [Propionibacteriaceae bacterium Y1923]|uniref:DUF3710 domain-containing protein n=1 Tax=Aestuariimicrobium sp. Y1814 TaxID=3418742 RepID=UPI003C1E08AF